MYSSMILKNGLPAGWDQSISLCRTYRGRADNLSTEIKFAGSSPWLDRKQCPVHQFYGKQVSGASFIIKV